MSVYFRGYELDDWNINNAYQKGTVVKYNNHQYEAIKDVPKGINIGFKEYWKDDVEEKIEDIMTKIGTITNYSTTEQPCAKWIDDSIIYKKTYEVTLGSSQQLIKEISEDINRMVNIEISMVTSTTTSCAPYCANSDTDKLNVYYRYSNKSLIIDRGRDYPPVGTVAYITLYYTKEK